MAKVQQKTSLCKEKISCTCKSFYELTKIKEAIYETANDLCFDVNEDPVKIIERFKWELQADILLKRLYRQDVEKLEKELEKHKHTKDTKVNLPNRIDARLSARCMFVVK